MPFRSLAEMVYLVLHLILSIGVMLSEKED